MQEDIKLRGIKHEVMYQVAKAAYEGTLKERIEEIPYEMIPGPQANFRCCIYKEREIIRQRVRLAQGKSPSANKDNKNIVQVINSACEGCPITRFTVTDNCQKCMSKRCQEACNFGAISMTKDRAYIDPTKCKECGKCATACPYNAIADLMRPCKRSCPVDAITMDDNNIVKIDEEKCIHCGACIKDCPFGAISDRSFLVDVINMIKSGKPVYACVAPAIEGQFGANATIGVLRQAMMELGFKDMFEVAIGADMVAKAEAQEWIEAYEQGKKMTTSCCPAFVNMIRKHYPEVRKNMSTTVSPMAAIARMVKVMNKDAIVVFIGPCIAKKSEVLEDVTQNSADYALTFEELDAMFRSKSIDLNNNAKCLQQASIYGKQFATSGGVTKAVLEAVREGLVIPCDQTEKKTKDVKEVTVKECNGALECKKALLLLKLGRLPEDFIEGMVCEGGCIQGPGTKVQGLTATKDRAMLLKEADQRTMKDSLGGYSAYEISLHRK